MEEGLGTSVLSSSASVVAASTSVMVNSVAPKRVVAKRARKGKTTVKSSSAESTTTKARSRRTKTSVDEVATSHLSASDQPAPKKPRRSKKSVEGLDIRSPEGDRAVPEEKRSARFRKKCPLSILERVNRVMSQRMYLIDRNDLNLGEEILAMFRVAGSTGNVYTITIGPLLSCDCPDFRNGNAPCKHIIFVFLKVLKVPQESNLWYQKALLPSELKQVFEMSPTPPATVMASEAARKALRIASGTAEEEDMAGGEAADEQDNEGKRLDCIDDDCPICYEVMSAQEHSSGKLTFDLSVGGCGRPVHLQCFRMWETTARTKGEPITCVWCRSQWVQELKPNPNAEVITTTSGYLNVADVIGVSRKRDTSTYWHGPIAGRGGSSKRDRRYDEGD